MNGVHSQMCNYVGMADVSLVELPSDVLRKIFLLVDLKTLITCRRVCVAWNNAMDEENFLNTFSRDDVECQLLCKMGCSLHKSGLPAMPLHGKSCKLQVVTELLSKLLSNLQARSESWGFGYGGYELVERRCGDKYVHLNRDLKTNEMRVQWSTGARYLVSENDICKATTGTNFLYLDEHLLVLQETDPQMPFTMTVYDFDTEAVRSHAFSDDERVAKWPRKQMILDSNSTWQDRFFKGLFLAVRGSDFWIFDLVAGKIVCQLQLESKNPPL